MCEVGDMTSLTKKAGQGALVLGRRLCHAFLCIGGS